jgi:hypothetical protein
MGRGSTGAKAGVVAGIIYGIILTVLSEIILFVEKSTVMAALTVYAKDLSNSAITITASEIYNSEILIAPVGLIIEGIIGGLILGAIFGLVVHKLPGRNDKVKGIAFGIILWVLFDVLLGLGDRAELGNIYYLLTVISGLVGVVIYGYLLGLLFGKWWVEPSTVNQNESFTYNN